MYLEKLATVSYKEDKEDNENRVSTLPDGKNGPPDN